MDDWFAAHENADDAWRDYEKARGRSFPEALQGLAARHIFEFDRQHILEADIGILLMPAGKSGHIELGFMAGRGKQTYVLLDAQPDRFDVMYAFFDGVYQDKEELFRELICLSSKP